VLGKLSPLASLIVIGEATTLNNGQLGEFFRKKGLHQTHLE
jgi:hypothetical protein